MHTGATFYNKGDATNTSRDKKFSGNAALSYIFDNGVAPYISYAESFQPTTGADMNSTSSLKPDRRQAMGNRCEVPAGGLRLAVHRRGL